MISRFEGGFIYTWKLGFFGQKMAILVPKPLVIKILSEEPGPNFSFYDGFMSKPWQFLTSRSQNPFFSIFSPKINFFKKIQKIRINHPKDSRVFIPIQGPNYGRSFIKNLCITCPVFGCPLAIISVKGFHGTELENEA